MLLTRLAAIGQAIRLANTTGLENCQISKPTISLTLAPITFLIPISLVLLSTVKADKPYKPKHAIERAMILSQSEMLTSADFQLDVPSHVKPSLTTSTSEHKIIADQFETTSAEIMLPKKLNLEKIEKNAIALALKKHRFNISHTAKELGLTRAALYRRMEKHGL